MMKEGEGYGQAPSKAEQMAAAGEEQGVIFGDGVVLWCDNIIIFIFLCVGCVDRASARVWLPNPTIVISISNHPIAQSTISQHLLQHYEQITRYGMQYFFKLNNWGSVVKRGIYYWACEFSFYERIASVIKNEKCNIIYSKKISLKKS